MGYALYKNLISASTLDQAPSQWENMLYMQRHVSLPMVKLDSSLVSSNSSINHKIYKDHMAPFPMGLLPDK